MVHTVNGFAIIAHEPVKGDVGFVILGSRYDAISGTYEYVTARMVDVSNTEWFWGNYFQGIATLGKAFEDMRNRAHSDIY